MDDELLLSGDDNLFERPLITCLGHQIRLSTFISLPLHLSSIDTRLPYFNMSDTAPEKPKPVRKQTLDQDAVERLDKAIGHRPDKQELVDRNILKDDGVAPSLQAARDQLQRAQLEDKLDHNLQNRPAAEDLVKKGILQANEAPPS